MWRRSRGATAEERGLLVLADQYDPVRRATVDGQPAAVLRVNHVLRVVILGAGQHEVVLQFAPASMRSGGLLSLLGLAVSATMLAVGWRRDA